MYIFSKEVHDMVQGYLDRLMVNGSLCWNDAKHRNMDCSALNVFIGRKIKEKALDFDTGFNLFKLTTLCSEEEKYEIKKYKVHFLQR